VKDGRGSGGAGNGQWGSPPSTPHPAGAESVSDATPSVDAVPPWRLWPERERVLTALSKARPDLSLRLCRWPLSLRDLSRRSGVPVQTLSRLRSQAAQSWPVYKRLDDPADAGTTIRAARRYARLRADLRAIDEAAAAEAQRLRAEGLGWKRVNAVLGAPPGADPSWLRVLLVRRTAHLATSAGRAATPAHAALHSTGQG